MRINRGRYYYEFLETVKKLRNENDSCFICGSTKRVNPHHIHKVKDSDKRFADRNNVVLLCGPHHHLFHQLYGSGKGVNCKNFAIFCKKEYEKRAKRI